MKRILFFACAALLLVSCTASREKKQVAEQQQNPVPTVYDAIGYYLVHEIGSQYAQAELCIPVQRIVAEEACESAHACVWGDFWVFWYRLSGDTLKTVSGGNHSGRMVINQTDSAYYVSGFAQTEDGAGNEASARRIFGDRYDAFWAMHSDEAACEAARQEQLREYIRRHGMNIRYYQDYGWPAVDLYGKAE